MTYSKIPGFSRYEINEVGAIRNAVTLTPISTQRDNDGYVMVALRNDNNVKRRCRVHRLVAVTYIPNPFNLETVNHKDENKLNNSISNLEWMSRSKNVSIARMGKRGNCTKTNDTTLKKIFLLKGINTPAKLIAESLNIPVSRVNYWIYKKAI